MKLIGMVISIFVFLNILPYGETQNPMVEMVKISKEEEIKLDSWKIYMQEEAINTLTTEIADQEINKLKANLKDYKFHKEQNENESHYKLIGKKSTGHKLMNEQAIITVYEEKESKRISLAYEITGKKWNTKTWEYLQSAYQQKLKEQKVFYTIYGSKTIREEIGIEKEANQLVNHFAAKTVEEIKEEHFISISAHKEDWKFKMPTRGNETFNLQVGVRENVETNKLDIAIGTPIITSGY
ncbi:YwmB family TATA-box binding protein [Bacillus sp. AK128]